MTLAPQPVTATPERYQGLELRYECERSRLSDTLAARFVRLDLDDATRAFLDDAAGRRASPTKTWLHRTLRSFMSDFDTNGVLGMYPMFLLSTRHWERLLGASPRRRHLDVGAGSGDVTATLAPLCAEVTTTETSWAMARRLRARGWPCHLVDLATREVPSPPYDLITCLNVLDRCGRPLSLLRKLRGALTESGVLVVATPLPFEPFVYDGGRTVPPTERLHVEGESWEETASSLVMALEAQAGLELVSLSRVPYLSGGDARRPVYALDDAVVVLRPRRRGRRPPVTALSEARGGISR